MLVERSDKVDTLPEFEPVELAAAAEEPAKGKGKAAAGGKRKAESAAAGKKGKK